MPVVYLLANLQQFMLVQEALHFVVILVYFLSVNGYYAF